MKPNSYEGKLIALEGLPGSGIKRQCKLLAQYLEGEGKRVLVTKEPTEDSEANKILIGIKNQKTRTTPTRFQELFAEDRSNHLKNLIEPELARGTFVVCNRYILTSLAHGRAQGLPIDLLMNLNQHFLEADLSIILDVHPSICIERLNKQGAEIPAYGLGVMEVVQQHYRKLLYLPNVNIITEGEKPYNHLAAEIQGTVKNLVRTWWRNPVPFEGRKK